MNKYAILLTLLISSSVFAHIKPGLWKGVDTTGQDCFMQVGAQTFVTGMAHPLNERIEVTIDGNNFSLQHPPVVSVEKSIVKFNHDLFESVLATKTGAAAVIIKMSHAEGFEGPTEWTTLNHTWSEEKAVTKVCSQLSYSQK